MKPKGSFLNPHAAAFIPLSKGGTENKSTCVREGGTENNSGNTTEKTTQTPNHIKASLDKGKPLSQMEELTSFDMDLIYLETRFPSFSSVSIEDVYLLNERDLEATVDMLNELEQFKEVESPEVPLEILDIGSHVSESTPSVDGASLKLKNAADEAQVSWKPSDSQPR